MGDFHPTFSPHFLDDAFSLYVDLDTLRGLPIAMRGALFLFFGGVDCSRSALQVLAASGQPFRKDPTSLVELRTGTGGSVPAFEHSLET